MSQPARKARRMAEAPAAPRLALAHEAPAGQLPVQLGPLGVQLGFLLRLAQEAAFDAFAARTGQAALRPGRYSILVIIAANPGISQTALGAAAGRDKSTLTPALADLERRGLIRRDRPPQDRRSYALTLTEVGRQVLEGLRHHAAAHDAALEALVGPADRAAFVAVLRRIIQGIGA
ncbi:MarR family winged helix-turn-helix transcriptional regulator [Falsiroseomonas selenitidurans]|uniref:Winged helix-turn-helix transcriptional regulator n=1 Tax=Falsiroseomonas selenitidurans TaxID=2716335 RepID=A0ABX1E2F0_9PROT|nr:MarR family winged helix-turn-helix transcriptional regulator [Falsiroseomonas selenitidurans]NKC31233.1 winged helix-turn-helix transcriptional regulator [Falsiroseomonas selenitidurans]